MKTVFLKMLFVSLLLTLSINAKNKICSSGFDQLIDVDSKNHKEIKLVLCKTEINKDFKKVYLLYFNGQKLIKKTLIDKYYPEGNQAKIRLSFLNHFKNGKELVIVTSWKQRLKETAEGILFYVHVYHIGNKFLQKIDNLFKYEFEGTREGKTIKAKFIKKQNIETRLQKLADLKSIYQTLKNKQTIHSLSVVSELLFRTPLTPKNLTPYNNIAYYLQKAGANEEAAYLLEKIVAKFPNRTVAYYNLGDAYWALGEKEKARKAYTTYIEQMCDKGLQKKIPKEVLKRVERKNVCK